MGFKKQSAKTKLKRKATNSGKQLAHVLLWGEKPSKGRRKA